MRRALAFSSSLLLASTTLVACGPIRFSADAGLHDDARPRDDAALHDDAADLRGTLSVVFAGDGSGSVSSSDGFIDCPGRCEHMYPFGVEVTLTAAPAATSAFTAWTSPCPSRDRCTFITAGAAEVTATFSTTRLEVTRSGAGTGTVSSDPRGIDCAPSCSAVFMRDTRVRLDATPDPFSRFAGWSGACTGTGACTIAMDAPHAVDASFELPDPPVANGQDAELVLGQSSFTTTDPNQGGESAATFDGPRYCATEGSRLWVSDGVNARILQWDSEPAIDKQPANIVIGQSSATQHMAGRTESQLEAYPSGVWVEGAILFAADMPNSRIMIWEAIPTMNGQAAGREIGQQSFTSLEPGYCTRDRIHRPYAVWVGQGQGKMLIADAANNRVLIYNSVPPTTGFANADVVLGQRDFDSLDDPSPPTASSMNTPSDVFYDRATDRLFVADSGNNRVLVWIGIPTVSGEPAHYVLGQDSPAANSPRQGPAGLSGPKVARVAFGSLFVSDQGNARVMIWTPIPRATGTPATRVLGQPNLTTIQQPTPAKNQILGPVGMCIAGTKLYVVDSIWNRVLRFALTP